MKSKTSIAMWIIYDVLALCMCIVFSLLLINNFDFGALRVCVSEGFLVSFAFGVLPHLILMSMFHAYKTLWIYAGPYDYVKMAVCPVFNSLIFFLSSLFMPKPLFTPNVYVLYLILSFIFAFAPRVVVKFYAFITHSALKSADGKAVKRVMVIGAGEAARIIISDIDKNACFSNSKVVCAIDDDISKTDKYINGVKIVGTRHDIVSSAKKYSVDIIVFAIPSLDAEEKREILEICSKTDCELKTMPSMNVINKKESEGTRLNVTNVKIEDLLERMPISLEALKNMDYVSGKVVMVTGGGGSIGSELCRQIIECNPKQLIIFDIYENNAYDIQNELLVSHPDADIVTLIGSVRDTARLDCVFSKYHPQIIYHAAAHKHVPLMEDSPNESVKNNVFGTYKTAFMADKYGVERFVLISTDKAVNPTNIMGASKRMCEMVVQSFSRRSKTEFAAVRFGNVLGSNGSVIPLFKKQIEAGGPVKVTHPEIIRYFMTIPEAVSLVLTAGAMAKGGEIFVLDMGKPVKIVDLAKKMIRLMGYRVDTDIKIEYIGLRPGEKLFEELLMDEEGLKCTDNKLIHIGKPIEFDEKWFEERLAHLKEVMYDDNADIRELVSEIVPTYTYKK